MQGLVSSEAPRRGLARKAAWLAALVVTSSIAGHAAASTVLVDQPYQPMNAGGYSNLHDWRWADPIVLSQDATVSRVTWYGASYAGQHNDQLPGLNFTLDIYAEAGGKPGSSVAEVVGAATLSDQHVLDRWNGEVYLFTLDLAPSSHIALSANTTYFVSIAAPAGSDFIWEEADSTCCAALSGDGGQTWTQKPYEKQAFSLIGDISTGPASTPSAAPEPAAWALMLSGFFGLGAMLRRRSVQAPA